MENNFECKNCNIKVFVPSYKMIFSSTGKKYTYPNTKAIVCSECHKPLEYINKVGDYTSITFGKFASASSEEKKIMLKKRSAKHFKGEVKEKAEHIKKNFNGISLT